LRLIASVQIQGEDAVKTTRFKEPRYLGDANNIVRILDQKGAQELLITDIEASITRVPNYEYIKELAEEVSIPFSYGGGLGNESDVKLLTSLGVERFVVGSSFYSDPQFVKDLSAKIGASSTAFSLDVLNWDLETKRIRVWTSGEQNGKEIEIKQIAGAIEFCDIGEVVIRLVDLDGVRDANAHSRYLRLLQFLESNIDALPRLQVLVGTGIDTTAKMEALREISWLDGFVVGSMVCRPENSDGVLISYPKSHSIL
jgi:cyclase